MVSLRAERVKEDQKQFACHLLSHSRHSSRETNTRNGSPYLFAKVRGKWTAQAAKQVFREIAVAAQDRGFCRVLYNAYVSSPETELHRFFLGETIAKHFGAAGIKLAGVSRRDLINTFGEDVAVNGGAVVRLAGERVNGTSLAFCCRVGVFGER